MDKMDKLVKDFLDEYEEEFINEYIANCNVEVEYDDYSKGLAVSDAPDFDKMLNEIIGTGLKDQKIELTKDEYDTFRELVVCELPKEDDLLEMAKEKYNND